MAKANINGIEMNYHTAGSGGAVVLIHGHPFNYTMWQPQIDAFSKHYQVITPDLRGYGKSSLPAIENTRFEDYATDVLQLLDTLGVESFHLGGLSMGGQIVMELYRQAPQRIKSLILADTFASLDTPEAKQGRYDAATRLEKEGMVPYAHEVIYKMMKSDHVATMPEAARFVVEMMKATDPAAAATALRARAERIDYLNEVLPQVNVPALIIVGRQDEFTPVAKAQEMAAKLKDHQIVVIEDAGHMPNLEHTNEFNSAVLDFLAEIH